MQTQVIETPSVETAEQIIVNTLDPQPMQVTNPLNPLYGKNIQDMNVKELKELAIARKLGSGVWRAGAKKEELIKALETGIVSESPSPVSHMNTENKSDIEGAIAKALTPIFANLMKPSMDTEAVKALVQAEMLKYGTQKIEVTMPSGQVNTLEGRQHYLFPLLLKLVQLRIPIALVGPAGSGKTQVCENVALALGLPFFASSFCSQTSEYSLKGYMDAQGRYVRTSFREAFELGGVFCGDEFDNGNPNTNACVNAGLSNGYMSFPDGMIKKHEDFVFIAAMNTFGQGGSREYVGRNALDGATLDRFAFVDFPYDTGLESAICGLQGVPSPSFDLMEGGSIDVQDWVLAVHHFRTSVNKAGCKVIVSPRASKLGSLMIQNGIGKGLASKMLLFKGLDVATLAKIKGVL